MVPAPDEAESAAMVRLLGWLQELESMRTDEVPFASAVAELRDLLADFRAWSAMGPDGRPWLSSGGALHLTDLTHAGASGRARTFVVGLDADRCSGPRLQDPFLPDSLRTALGGGLATTAARRAERRELLERAFASLAGRVTLSYSIESDGGREAAPAPILLSAGRQLFGRPGLTYDDLREALGAPASPVPSPGAQPCDGRDAWFEALTRGALMLDGSAAVRAAFPRLTAGLGAAAAWQSGELGPQHGLVPAAAHYDPRTRPDRPVSASSLEKLARCPRAWLYDYVLGLEPPEEPEFDPARWLDATDRGSLLHEVFERFGRAYAGRQDELDQPVAEAELLATGDAVIAEWLDRIPAPSDAVFDREREEIRAVLHGFLLMERALPPGRAWQRFELGFGRGDRAVSLILPGGARLPLTGRIDRVDRLPDGSLVVVDYKTGSARRFTRDARHGAFAGGRHLQAGLYAHVAAELEGGRVARFEYRFPSERGQHRIVPFEAGEFLVVPALVAGLLDEVAQGHFLPTTSSDDCRYCDFQPICRVAELPYYKLASPRAEWAEAHAEELEVYRPMRQRRGEAT
jgi:ATP-dependent helicase/nuclease subunit B